MLLLLLLPFLTAKASDRCQRFWDFDTEIKPIPFRAATRRIPSYVRRWRQLIAHSPRNLKKHFYYKAKKGIRPKGLWGNYGWDKSFSTYKTPIQKEYGKLFALGAYIEHLDSPEKLSTDIEEHYRFAREHRCLNKRKKIYESFMESIPLGQF